MQGPLAFSLEGDGGTRTRQRVGRMRAVGRTCWANDLRTRVRIAQDVMISGAEETVAMVFDDEGCARRSRECGWP